MKKVCSKWKVFLIVLCMLFTMTPTAVFAEEPVTPPAVVEDQSSDQTVEQSQEEPGTSTEGTNPEGTATPPGITDPPTPPVAGDPEAQLPGDGQSKNEFTTESNDLQVTNSIYYGKGSITVKKDVTGDNPASDATFTFTLTGPYGYSSSFDIVGEGEKTINNLYPGDYVITEADVDHYTALDNGKTIKVKAWENTKFTFKNKYTAPTTGTLTIHKEIVGNPESPATFQFKIEKRCGFYGYYWYEDAGNASIVGAGSTEPIELKYGRYKITELSVDNYTIEDPVRRTDVTVGENADVYFVNTYTGPETGSIEIIKTITGDDPQIDETFVFTITGVEFSTSASIVGEGSCVVSGLNPGSYTVSEESIDDYTPMENDLNVDVVAGTEPAVASFTNVYDDPNIDDPKAWVTKTVAEYDGTNMPLESKFKKELSLNKLNKKVIYKIELACNREWSQRERTAALKDIYEQMTITGDLLVYDGTAFLKAEDQDSNFPYWLYINYEDPSTYYYIDTLTSNGTYTNTAYLCEPERAKTLTQTEEEPTEECNVISSSSAIVTVKYSSGGGGGGGGGGSRHYEVTYDPNYPPGADTSGAVPVDSNNYAYNNPVHVKGNIGDLAAGTYVFEGWNTKPDGSGTAYSASDIFNIKADVTLYAQWKLVGETETETIVIEEETPALAQEAALDDVPKTGDSTPLLPMMLLGILSAGALLTFGRRRPDEN